MNSEDEVDDSGGDGDRVRLSDLQSLARFDESGIRCPECHGTHFEVISTRRKPDKIVRRRRCRHCDRQILTTERLTG
ncbi:MAG: hypothetical protein AAFV88_14040 [Planctomycetota bacterium]